MHRINEIFGKFRKLFLSAAGVVAVALPIVFGLTNATSGSAQSQDKSPVANAAAAEVAYKFEVATIKLLRPTGSRGGIGGFFGENTFRANDWSLKAVIRFAYEIPI